jgi:hypothetical protein
VRRALPTSPFASPSTSAPVLEHLEAGDRVTHDRLGVGRVLRLAEDQIVIVDFGHPDGVARGVPHHSLTKL